MLYEFNSQDPTRSARVPIKRPEDLRLTEKHIEDFIAKHLHDILPEDQLLLIGQERKWQEEADLFALDRKGTLYIFELKRWQSAAENLLQVLRYGQIFGQYGYNALQDLARRHEKLKGDLAEQHQRYFELDTPLVKTAFNADQVFVVVTNGVDRHTLDAIRYWKQKHIRIDSLTYRFYDIGGKPHLWFDVYNPEQEVIAEENPGIYCINTCATYIPDAWQDMLKESKASAYGGRRYAVAGVPKGSTIYLYHTGIGIIAKGKTTAPYREADDDEEEFLLPLIFEWKLSDKGNWDRAVKAWEINQALGTGHKFRQTCFAISKEMGGVIDQIWKGKELPSTK